MAEATIDTSAHSRAENPAIPTTPSLAGYRAFSPKLAPTLSVLGGALTILGGLGTWIRTVQYTVSIGRSAKEGPAVMGHSDLGGWAIAAVGLLALVSAAAWTMKGLLPKLVPVLTALGVAAVAAWRLPILNDHVAAMIEDARRSVGVTGFYHVGFGWGAWLLFAAPFVLIVGVVAGILRDVDQRKGLAG